jgi:hypothetical protein
MAKTDGIQFPFDGDPSPRAFVQGVSWPVECAGLSALLDLGLNEVQIATYFSVQPADVSARRQNCGDDL